MRGESPSSHGVPLACTWRECSEPAMPSLSASVMAIDDAGEKVYEPCVWQTLKSRMAVVCSATSAMNEAIWSV